MEIDKSKHTVTIPVREYNELITAYEAPKKEKQEKIDFMTRYVNALGSMGVSRTVIEEAARIANINQ